MKLLELKANDFVVIVSGFHEGRNGNVIDYIKGEGYVIRYWGGTIKGLNRKQLRKGIEYGFFKSIIKGFKIYEVVE